MKDIEIFEDYFKLFNKFFFDNELPNCIITMQRHKKARGYFWANVFASRHASNITAHEIALNPISFDRTMKEILSTLLHEMCHMWQQEFGTRKSLKAYHNKEWADKMESVGLMPSDTGEEGGKRTGQRMTHYIIKDGAYEEFFCRNKFLEIEWKSRQSAEDLNGKKEKAKSSKNKFSCPECGLNAWAKDSARLFCGDCNIEMELDL